VGKTLIQTEKEGPSLWCALRQRAAQQKLTMLAHAV
jgi:hypothetical protein